MAEVSPPLVSSLHTVDTLVNPTGPSAAIPSLCASLAARGNPTELHVLEAPPGRDGVRVVEHRRARLLGFYGRSPHMRRSLSELAHDVDVVHAHKLWLLHARYAFDSARRAGKPFVLTPHGSLAEAALRISRYRKGLVWRLWQRRLCESAHLVHATSDKERDEIRALGLRTPIAVIPNTVPLPDVGGVEKRPEILFLGRIHPIKAIDRLLLAWAKVAPKYPDWRLRVVGPGEGSYADELHRLVDVQRIPRVEFHPPVFGAEKDRLLTRSSLLVLPSLTENFGMSVAEALAAGTAAIVSSETPWSEIRTLGCGWVFESDGDLADALDEALDDPAGTILKGTIGREWVARRFAPERIGDLMAGAYRWLLGGGPPPDVVDLA